MSKINLRPLDDRVVVEPVDAEEITPRGPAGNSTAASVVNCRSPWATKST